MIIKNSQKKGRYRFIKSNVSWKFDILEKESCIRFQREVEHKSECYYFVML